MPGDHKRRYRGLAGWAIVDGATAYGPSLRPGSIVLVVRVVRQSESAEKIRGHRVKYPAGFRADAAQDFMPHQPVAAVLRAGAVEQPMVAASTTKYHPGKCGDGGATGSAVFASWTKLSAGG